MKQKQSHKCRNFFIILLCLTVVGVGIYAFMGGFANLKMESPIKYWVQAVNNGDSSKELMTLPPEMRKAYKKLDRVNDDTLKEKKANEFGDNEITYSIIDQKKIDEQELGILQNSLNIEMADLANEAGIAHKDISISEGYEVRVELKYGEESKDYTFTVYKSGIRWYMFHAEETNSALVETDDTEV